MARKTLGIGFIGSGFITDFHIRGMIGVRDADVLGLWSPDKTMNEKAAATARNLKVGDAEPYPSITAMVEDPAIDAIFVCAPNFARIENIEEVVYALKSGKGELKGIACEKPLARNVREAKKLVELVKSVELNHGYLEDQIFSPSLTRSRDILWKRAASITGRPYLVRSAEEHSGPHQPWFWDGELQGGGVLNDMMCHSVEVARFMLTEPGKPRSSVRPKKVTCNISSLKWTRPEYIQKLKAMSNNQVDYAKKPVEDYASATIEFEEDQGHQLIGEMTNSWSYVGAGLRLTTELLGPEYSMQMNSLDSGPQLFLSREVKGDAGEDLVEKQNAESGVMPIVSNEASEYGYEGEDRHFVQCFLEGKKPDLTFDDGLEVVELLMTAYMSAERGQTIEFKRDNLEDFVPAVARGAWSPKG